MTERDVLRMTDAEVAAFLEEGRRAQVATYNRDGTIHLVPMSYVMRDGKLTLWTDPDSRKVLNLRADARITCLVELGEEFTTFRAVQIVGSAVLISDSEGSRAVGEALFRLSVGELSDDMLAYVARLAQERVAVTVEPSRIVSWDHRKLADVRPDQVGA